jgi:prevent-host-death family protein
MPAKEAKNNFGALLDAARRAPVTIQRNGRNVAVMVAYEDFEKMHDHVWVDMAHDAKKEGVLSQKESATFLENVLHA